MSGKGGREGGRDGKHIKTFPSVELARGIFGLCMGEKAISPEAKKGFAAVAPRHLK